MLVTFLTGSAQPSTTITMSSKKQHIQQPDFKKSDRRFRPIETISSAGFATDRSGNEREVNLEKMSGEIMRGLQPAGDMERLDNAWLAFSFQVNFMFESVL